MRHLQAENKEKPWGEAVVAALLVNLVTFVGVLFLCGEIVATRWFRKDVTMSKYYHAFTRNVIPSFACGAMMATAVYLVLPESFHLISMDGSSASGHHDHRVLADDEHDSHNENAAIWKFGVSVICGFLIPVMISNFFPHVHCENIDDIEKRSNVSPATGQGTSFLAPCVKDECELCDDGLDDTERNKTDFADNKEDEEGADPGQVVITVDDGTALPKSVDYSSATTILVGDFFHNFADGVFIGTAFLVCSRDLAIGMSLATIYHEIPQELADYFMLTQFCNIKPAMALTLNFLTGLSVMAGVCLIMAIEAMKNTTIGIILGMSGGIHLYIAIGECFTRARKAQENLKDKLVSMFSFVCGVVPIGLVLLNHGHC